MLATSSPKEPKFFALRTIVIVIIDFIIIVIISDHLGVGDPKMVWFDREAKHLWNARHTGLSWRTNFLDYLGLRSWTWFK